MFESINGELFFVELEEGDSCTRENICCLGHDLAESSEVKNHYTIPKGTCKKCGFGLRYFKCSKKESERYHAELRSLC